MAIYSKIWGRTETETNVSPPLVLALLKARRESKNLRDQEGEVTITSTTSAMQKKPPASKPAQKKLVILPDNPFAASKAKGKGKETWETCALCNAKVSEVGVCLFLFLNMILRKIFPFSNSSFRQQISQYMQKPVSRNSNDNLKNPYQLIDFLLVPLPFVQRESQQVLQRRTHGKKPSNDNLPKLWGSLHPMLVKAMVRRRMEAK